MPQSGGAPDGQSALHFALQGRMNQMQQPELVRQLSGDHEAIIGLLLAAGADPMVGHLSALWYSASDADHAACAAARSEGGAAERREWSASVSRCRRAVHAARTLGRSAAQRASSGRFASSRADE